MGDCRHEDFDANVNVNRLYDVDDDEDVTTYEPDSVAIEVTVSCAQCGKAVRFEGPIGVAVGPGSPVFVSFDGTELRAAGHLGENRSPSIHATLRPS